MWTSRLTSRSRVFRSFRLSTKDHSIRNPRSHWHRHFTTTPRPAFTHATLREAIASAREQYPIVLPITFIATVASVTVLGLVIYDEYTRVAPAYAAYPEPVEQRLRWALHYTHLDPDPDKASTFFREAIEIAEAVGMDPLSEEALGLRIRYAEALEKYGRVKASIEVLNSVKSDLEQGLKDIDVTANPSSAPKRKELLRSVIEHKVKIASLYNSDYIQDRSHALKIMSNVMNTLVSETPDAQKQGLSENNNVGLSNAEIATILTQIGDMYATDGQEQNAVQAYILAKGPLDVACNGNASCKQVQLQSNLLAAMVLTLQKQGLIDAGQSMPRENNLFMLRSMLTKADEAIAVAKQVKPEDQNDMCTMGVISAKMSKGYILHLLGNEVQSIQVHRELLPVLRGEKLTTLVDMAEAAIEKSGAAIKQSSRQSERSKGS